MKILSVGVSNIRSFRYHEDGYDSIDFGTDKLNLIIGPNGAGKSNLMEIVARIFSNLFNVDYSNGNEDIGRLISINSRPTPVVAELATPSSLTKNRNFKDKPSTIRIKVRLEQSDLDNLATVRRIKQILKNIDDRLYVVEGPETYKGIFDLLDEAPSVPTEYEITLSDEATIENQNRSFRLVEGENVAYWYLRSYHMLRNAIDAYNDYLHPELFTQIQYNNPNYNYEASLDSIGIDLSICEPVLRFNPLLQILSVQERLNEVTLDYTPVEASLTSNSRANKQRSLERQATMRSFLGGMNTAQSMTFEFIKERLLIRCLEELVTDKTKEQVVRDINSSDIVLRELNQQLAWFNLKIQLEELDIARMYIKLKMMENSHRAEVIDLSSGQKAIVNIASAIALTKVTDAVVVIDEIENHLHPGVQSRLRKMLLEGASNGAQVVAVTHSPVFIDSATLEYTYRVHSEDGFSTILECKTAFSGTRAKDLEAILNYTNGARIFFTNKVVLVEGITDELFFRAYTDLRTRGGEIEILNVGGDTERMLPWRTMMESIGVRVFQINDFDQAVQDTSPVPSLTKSKPKGVGLDRGYIRSDDLSRVDDVINNAKTDGKFYLKEGSLEEYYASTIPKTKRKKFERVVEFLGSQDWSQLLHDNELNAIFEAIESA